MPTVTENKNFKSKKLIKKFKRTQLFLIIGIVEILIIKNIKTSSILDNWLL